MATTYEAIATVTVGSGGAANIEFTSIAADWTDLICKYSIRAATGGVQYVNLTINTSTASFTTRGLEGDGATAYSYSSTNLGGVFAASTYTADTFASGELYFPNYAGSTNKSYSSDSVTENNATTSYATLLAGLWSNTSAITSIKLTLATAANLAQHSTATLYGIKNS